MDAFKPEDKAYLEAQGEFGKASAIYIDHYLINGDYLGARDIALAKFPNRAAPPLSAPPPQESAKGMEAPPSDPKTLSAPDNDRQCSFYHSIVWASENLYTPALRPRDAPSQQAWAIWQTFSTNAQTRREFLLKFGPAMLPSKTELEFSERFKDDGGIIEGIDEIRKLSEESMVEAFLSSRPEASFRQPSL